MPDKSEVDGRAIGCQHILVCYLLRMCTFNGDLFELLALTNGYQYDLKLTSVFGYSVPLLVKAIQELSAKVTALEEQVLNLGVK